MNLFVVSFFGHRKVDDPFVIERQLESIIREMLLTKEYVEFLERSRKRREVIEEAQEVVPIEEPFELEHPLKEEKEPVFEEAVEVETEAEPIPEEIAEEETI